jgi:hypothetical protein
VTLEELHQKSAPQVVRCCGHSLSQSYFGPHIQSWNPSATGWCGNASSCLTGRKYHNTTQPFHPIQNHRNAWITDGSTMCYRTVPFPSSQYCRCFLNMLYQYHTSTYLMINSCLGADNSTDSIMESKLSTFLLLCTFKMAHSDQ